ncbi:hypothetical protein D4764_01G0000040 [Takifugu flavidus]|uniref:Uncharacterized protein n=1 Tax=Takifugu flavidus TaxID=433684 RepID=A0A5C6PMM1_9TELE|nr:hypothetical protein D4764_01G0000040 [Takifugu flavidus]
MDSKTKTSEGEILEILIDLIATTRTDLMNDAQGFHHKQGTHPRNKGHRVEELKRETLADPVCRHLSQVVAAAMACSSVASVSSSHTPCSATTYSSCTRATSGSRSQSAELRGPCFGQLSTLILNKKCPGVPPVMLSDRINQKSPSDHTQSLTCHGPSLRRTFLNGRDERIWYLLILTPDGLK